MKDGEDKAVQHGYGDMAARARQTPLVFEQFKDGRGLGRWEEASSYQLRNALAQAGLTEAAVGVYDGFILTVAGMGTVVQDLNKIRGGVNDSSHIHDKLLKYTSWQKLVLRKYGMNRLNDCLDIICREVTVSDIDKKRGTKHPHARNDLIAVLMLFQDAR